MINIMKFLPLAQNLRSFIPDLELTFVESNKRQEVLSINALVFEKSTAAHLGFS